MALASGTGSGAADVGKHSSSRSSRSKTGSLHESANTQHIGSGRPYSRLQSPIQQQDVHVQHMRYQYQQHYHSDSALSQPVCCSSTAKQCQDMSPGQISSPCSRLEHADSHDSCHHQRPGSSTSNHLVNSGIAEAEVRTGPSTAMGHDTRHGNRCVHSSMGYYSGDASQYRPNSCSTSGNGLRSSRPGTGSPDSTKQQQPVTASGAGRNGSLNGSYGMEPISEQHDTANPLYANSSAATLLCKSSHSGIRNAGKTSSPMVTPRKPVGSYTAGLATLATSQHSTRSIDPTASNAVQPANLTQPESSSGRSTGSIRNSSTLHNDNMHSPRALASSSVVNPMQHEQQLRVASSSSSTTGQVPNTHTHSRQGYRPTSGILRASSSGGGRQQQTSGVCKPQPGVLSQDAAPASPKLAAAYLGRGSSSRPSSASGHQGPSAAVHGQVGPAREPRSPSRQQQQKPRQQSAISATPLSVLVTPRRNNSRPQSSSVRPNTAARGRPQTTASHDRLDAGGSKRVAEAAGPLLSEYFRPPSAAAPGCVGLFGLPGMEPPGALASAIPCVKVPSVHASWDAAVAGLSLSHSSGIESPSASVAAVAATQHSGAGQQQQPGQPPAARLHLQAHSPQHRPVTKPGPVRPSTSGSTSQLGHARPGTSSRAQRPGTVGCLAADNSHAIKQQLLLWSAAHEIDGRPVTRNGERARRSIEDGLVTRLIITNHAAAPLPARLSNMR